MRTPYKGVQQGRGRADHLCGVLNQGVAEVEVSSAGVSNSSSYRGTTLRALHVPPFLVQGGGGPRGGRTAALL